MRQSRGAVPGGRRRWRRLFGRFPDQHIRLPALRDRHQVGRAQPRSDAAEEPGVGEQFGGEAQGRRQVGLELLILRIVRPGGAVDKQ